MTHTEAGRIKLILLTKQAEITGSLRSREDILIEKAPDALDEVQLMGERELAVRSLDRSSGLLRQIRRALWRAAQETLGTCAHWEEEISPKRMAAVPWAAYCIKCQDRIDRREIDEDDSRAMLELAS